MVLYVAGQGVLIPNYILYKDVKGGAAYFVPQGTEIETYRKVRPACLCPSTQGLHKGCIIGRSKGSLVYETELL